MLDEMISIHSVEAGNAPWWKHPRFEYGDNSYYPERSYLSN
jgi:hypothetical protein